MKVRLMHVAGFLYMGSLIVWRAKTPSFVPLHALARSCEHTYTFACPHALPAARKPNQ